jgi:hypothetical protein
MVKFPTVNEKQVVLLRSDYNSGDVLDEGFVSDVNMERNVYTVFNCIDESVAYIRAVFSRRDDVEFIVYDGDKKVLKYISKDNPL